ncbi:uncharacterized protein BKCO1_33000105 [Diplodia corticola]|uniref:Uncharacterized protein n=1 Tax=Diplodia corticola TaxID=236234 RepID=A0A1J9QYL8_9PEZI|nr:uncharacterized protein BKCO1_33000105 [Diplodia corticola]OJD33098.1 hypothetical protein BKCO1_33000105 [Diplodia corticola]
MPEEEALLGECTTIFVKGNFRYQHCAYIWVKQMRAKTRFPLVLDSASRSEEHSRHCINLVGNPNVTKVGDGDKVNADAGNSRFEPALRCSGTDEHTLVEAGLQ